MSRANASPPTAALGVALVVVSSVCAAPAWQPSPGGSVREVNIERLLATTPLVDGHNDFVRHFIEAGRVLGPAARDFLGVAAGQTDIARWRAGGVAASFVTISGTYRADVAKGLEETLDVVRGLTALYPEDIVLAGAVSDVRAAHAAKRIGLIPHVEGGEQLGGSIERLRALHALGVRSLGLTWNRSNDLADAALDAPRWNGVSSRGEAVIREMNCLGMLIDLSHASDDAARAALSISKAAVVFSHSSARAVAGVPRNLPDDILRRVALNGGVVMVTFVPYFTTAAYAAWYERGEAEWERLRQAHADDARAERKMKTWEALHPPPAVTIDDVVQHVEHVRKVAGVNHVGFGSDFDGMYSNVTGLEDVSTFPVLLARLAARGWSEPDLRKVMGENVLRAWHDVERVSAAARTQR